MEGWIKIHKKLRENDLIKQDHSAFVLFMAILLHVKTSTGTYAAGRYQLAEMTGLNPETVRKALKRLEQKWKIIATQSTNRFTEIRVLNWAKYQGRDTDSTNQVTNKVPTKYQQSTTKKELRTKKEEDMSEVSDAPSQFDTFWNSYPKKELKKKSLEIWKRKKLDKHLPEILAFIEKAKQTDRWKKGFVKQPTTFLNNESWNDDLTSYGDQNTQSTAPPSMTYKTVDEIMAEKGLVDEKIGTNHFDRSQLTKTFKHSQ